MHDVTKTDKLNAYKFKAKVRAEVCRLIILKRKQELTDEQKVTLKKLKTALRKVGKADAGKERQIFVRGGTDVSPHQLQNEHPQTPLNDEDELAKPLWHAQQLEKHKWEQLLRRESLRFVVVNDSPKNREERASKAFKETVREWWAAVEDILEVYTRAQLKDTLLLPHPTEVLLAVKNNAGDLAVGRIPRPIADVASEGHRSLGPIERRDISFGVAYIRGANMGLIKDKTPTKTVAEAFGVPKKTVQSWNQHIQQAVPNVGCVDGDLLESLMRRAGKRYHFNHPGPDQLA